MCALIALAAVCAFVLAGCKYSDVLTQHTEDPAAGIDENADPIYESNPDAEERPDLANISIDDADDEDTQVAKLPHYDPSAPDNGPTKQLKKSAETPHDEEAAEGQEEGDPDRNGEGQGENGGKSNTSGNSNDPEGEDEGTGENLASDEAEEPGDESTSGGAGGSTVDVNPDGVQEDTAKGTVAAVGEYATIVQMLGGAGALVACDQSWLDARAADGAFSGELSKVKVAFSGDGSASGSCDVNALINTVKPSVVLWDGSKPALSNSEKTQLQNAGITVQAVPTIGEATTEDYAVTSAVQIVAGVLSGASGLQFDPSIKLARYMEVHDSALKSCYTANGGYSYKVTNGTYNELYQETPLAGFDDSTTTRVTTVYAAEMWTPSVSEARIEQSAATESGVIRLAHDGQVLDLSDDVALSVRSGANSYQLIDYYLQLSGVVNNAYDTAKPDASNKPYILMPGGTAAFERSDNFASRLTASAFFYPAGDASVAGNWKVLGNGDFNTVLAASEGVADKMAISAGKSDGLYRMESPYRIIVVPSGIAGSWAGGHVDSFLLAPWAWYLRGEDNLSAAASYAEVVYTEFFRCSDWESAIADWNYVKNAGS